MNSGLKEPLGFSAIESDAAYASWLELPTTNVLNRYRGLNTEVGISVAVGVAKGGVSPLESASGTKWRLRPSEAMAFRMERICWPYRSWIASTNLCEGTETSMVSPFCAKKRVGANQVTYYIRSISCSSRSRTCFQIFIEADCA